MKKTFTITAQCVVKNEQTYFGYALQSVIDYMDRVIIFDTGSTDNTPQIAREFVKKYPDKVEFYEKEPPEFWPKHSEYRQEQLAITTTDWFMILDGDEVWTKRGIEEAMHLIEEQGKNLNAISVDCFLCTGDIFHDHNRKLMAKINGIVDLRLTRFYKVYPGEMYWVCRPELAHSDFIRNGKLICDDKEHHVYLKNKMWHMTHLRRSDMDDNDMTSNRVEETRKTKRRDSYFIIGEKIREPLPEVFDEVFKKKNRVSALRSFINFWPYFYTKVRRKFIRTKT